MQANDQIVSVIPAFLQEGKVADVEEVKSSRHINYSVTLLWSLTKIPVSNILQTCSYLAV